jgi:hypothetical protein
MEPEDRTALPPPRILDVEMENMRSQAADRTAASLMHRRCDAIL